MSDFLKPDWDRLNELFGKNPHPVFAFYGPGGGIVPVDAVRRATNARSLWRGSTNKSEHFETWESVFAIAGKADYLGLGPCILLREIDRTVCIDLDPYEPPKDKPYNEFDAKRHRERIDAIAAAAQQAGCIVERSRSGQGWHIFTRGEWPNRMDNLPDGLGEIFGARQHINLTGNFLPPIMLQDGLTPLQRGEKFLQEITQFLFNGHVEKKADLLASLDLVETDECGRRLDLTDEQVIEALEYAGQETPHYTPHERFREVWQMYTLGTRVNADHSEDMFRLASAFDKITGDHNQVLRLLAQSALYLFEPQDKKGEDRIHKFERNARKGFYRIRDGNNKALSDDGALFVWRPYQLLHITKALDINRSWTKMFSPASKGSLAAKFRAAVIDDARQGANYRLLVSSHSDVVMTQESNGVNTPEMTIPNYLADWPPGVTGQLAREFYEMMHYPNQTVAVTWAIFMIQGLAQRSFLCEGNPLNGYYLVLAGTGEGKDLFTAAIQLFFDQLKTGGGRFHDLAQNMIGPSEYASGPAIHKKLASSPRVISVLNEASFLFESLANKSDRLAQEKKRKLLEVRYAGRKNGFLGEYIHSDKDKNTVLAYSPSLHLLCEGQPARYYDALNIDQFIDGFPQRFTIVDVDRQWKGKRRQYADIRHHFSEELIKALVPLLDVINKSHTVSQPPEFIELQISDEARKLFTEYEEWKDSLSKEHQYVRYLAFNRAVATGFSLAGALACGDNSLFVTEAHAKWAIKFVHETLDRLAKKVESDEVGFSQKRQIAAIVEQLKKYPKTRDNRIKPEMQKDGIFPLWWIKYKVLDGPNSKLFSGNRNRGEVDELISTLSTMIQLDMIEPVVASATVGEKNGTKFRIKNYG